MSDIKIKVNKGHLPKKEFITELLKVMVPSLTGNERSLLIEMLCTNPRKLDYESRKLILKSDTYKDSPNAERAISVALGTLCTRKYSNEFLVTKLRQGTYQIANTLAKHIELLEKQPNTKIEITLTYDPHAI